MSRPVPPASLRIVKLAGYAVHIDIEHAPLAWQKLVKGLPRRQATRPQLTLRLGGASRKSEDVLTGSGFTLDYGRRELHYPSRTLARWFSGPRDARICHLAQAALGGIALLYERFGAAADRLLSLHCSGVATRRGALLFCGPSGRGKSTIATKLLRHLPQLHDDQNFLLASKRDVLHRANKPMCVLCYPSSKYDNRTHFLAGLFWLKQSPTFGLRNLSTTEAAAKLLSPLIGADRHPQITARRLELLRGLLRFTRCQELSFAKDRRGLLRFLKASKVL